ncbi:unnamed protein product [Prorocentrum cordatum]|uniref:Thioredoxin domain-containing protein n=1 Tax=Prorocentrum cordatum TaxID=2364126 RepID=A0ABN9TXU5_9DINO|nr:unnamed protein product [Polarella glacialis]
MVIDAHDYTFVNFYADWCPHCRAFGPTWTSFEEKLNSAEEPVVDADGMKANVRVLKINCVDFEDCLVGKELRVGLDRMRVEGVHLAFPKRCHPCWRRIPRARKREFRSKYGESKRQARGFRRPPGATGPKHQLRRSLLLTTPWSSEK